MPRKQMHSRYRPFHVSVLFCCALTACAPTSTDSTTGAGGQATGGATGSEGGSGGSSAEGGASGSTATGGVGATVGSGGAAGTTSSGGSGGSAVSGTGGSGAIGGGGGSRGGAAGGGSAGTTGSGGKASSGGAPGSGGAVTGSGGAVTGSGGAVTGSGGSGGISTGAGGAGGKPDQSTLPPLTIHMAGDSTMSNYTADTTQEGWGQELGQFFISAVTIDNQAQPGANIQTFYTGRWKTLINNVKAGDYVMAAFGINDSGTTHGPVTPADFQTQMGVMADEVAAKKATFIPTTSSPLQMWVGGKETNTRLQPYCDATIALGTSKGLLVDDLNALGVAYYNMIGQTAAAALTFNGDKAHFDKQGATEMAQLASQELAKIKSPLAAYLK
jgi:hypothetical protein